MRKYFQIIIVLGSFFLLVFVKNYKGDREEVRRVVGPPQQPSSQSSSGAAIPPSAVSQGFKDGTFTGSVEDAYYGLIQVRVAVQGGRITDVTFLQYPNDNGTSVYINSQAMPILKQEAIQAQSTNVDIISGASDTSMAFRASLGNALSQSKI